MCVRPLGVQATLADALGDIEDSVSIVLVRPARAENVGAACRALKNMGFARLSLVEPAPPSEERATRNSAYGAWDILDSASRFESLREAVAGVHCVIGTSGRLMAGRSIDVRALGAAVGDRGRSGQRTALVFGPESSGLTGAELDVCHWTIHIPSDPAQPSLNLAQAVLLVCWEIRRSLLDAAITQDSDRDTTDSAMSGEVEACLDDVRDSLLAVGYLNPQNPELILAEIRRLLARARPTRRELSLLRGMARQARWAGRLLPGR